MEAEYKHYMNVFFVKIENEKSILIHLDETIEYYDYVLKTFSEYEKSTKKDFLHALNQTIFTINEKTINGL